MSTLETLPIELVEQFKLVHSDPTAGDQFGEAVVISEDGKTALIGAKYRLDAGCAEAGVVYVFAQEGTAWIQQAKLTHSDPAAGDNFGNSLAISNDGSVALIGAVNKTDSDRTGQGAAYVFIQEGSTWVQQAKLVHDDPAANDYFGNSVSLSSDGGTALIGAYNKTESGRISQGAVYVFNRAGTTWTQQAKLTHDRPDISDNFGYVVALSSSGVTALIGATCTKERDRVDQDVAYVFVRNGDSWTQQAKLPHDNVTGNDQFGNSVMLTNKGNTVVVGVRCKIKTDCLYQCNVCVFNIQS